MTNQTLPLPSSSSRLKGQNRLLFLQRLGYLIPLSLLSPGLVLAQSSPTPTVKPLPSFSEEGQSSSVLEPIQANESVRPKPALPDYESVPPIRLNEPETPTQQVSSPSPQGKPQPKLQPIQPLVNNSSHTPQVSSEVPRVSPTPTVTESSPKPSTPIVEFEQRKPETPTQTTVQQPPVREETPKTAGLRELIDLNGYPETAENNSPSPRVEVVDRNSNCTTVVENGQLVSGSCNISQQSSQESTQAFVEIEKLPELPKTFQQPNRQQSRPIPPTYTPPEDLPQLKLPGNGDSGLLFPLARSTPISSHYGWRIHPILGNRRFHTGTDFTAPEGTPVVAVKSGRVNLANYTSGYGLIVGLLHDNSNESRYAHLSQIHVRPGQWVEQGTVIGRVGSTGLSTGPHLHFEWRIRKGSRWIAVNAANELIAARDHNLAKNPSFSTISATPSQTQDDGMNFLAFLPEILAAIPAPPASWMSVPEFGFLNQGHFNQVYERKASLASFSQRNHSVVVMPLSLPKVLASIFHWQLPQLFAQENLKQVSSQHQVGYEFAYQPPTAESQPPSQQTLESLTNLDALGTLNFPSPTAAESQELSLQN